MPVIVLLVVSTAYLLTVYLLLALAQRTTKVTPTPSRNTR